MSTYNIKQRLKKLKETDRALDDKRQHNSQSNTNDKATLSEDYKCDGKGGSGIPSSLPSSSGSTPSHRSTPSITTLAISNNSDKSQPSFYVKQKYPPVFIRTPAMRDPTMVYSNIEDSVVPLSLSVYIVSLQMLTRLYSDDCLALLTSEHVGPSQTRASLEQLVVALDSLTDLQSELEMNVKELPEVETYIQARKRPPHSTVASSSTPSNTPSTSSSSALVGGSGSVMNSLTTVSGGGGGTVNTGGSGSGSGSGGSGGGQGFSSLYLPLTVEDFKDDRSSHIAIKESSRLLNTVLLRAVIIALGNVRDSIQIISDRANSILSSATKLLNDEQIVKMRRSGSLVDTIGASSSASTLPLFRSPHVKRLKDCHAGSSLSSSHDSCCSDASVNGDGDTESGSHSVPPRSRSGPENGGSSRNEKRSSGESVASSGGDRRRKGKTDQFRINLSLINLNLTGEEESKTSGGGPSEPLTPISPRASRHSRLQQHHPTSNTQNNNNGGAAFSVLGHPRKEHDRSRPTSDESGGNEKTKSVGGAGTGGTVHASPDKNKRTYSSGHGAMVSPRGIRSLVGHQDHSTDIPPSPLRSRRGLGDGSGNGTRTQASGTPDSIRSPPPMMRPASMDAPTASSHHSSSVQHLTPTQRMLKELTQRMAHSTTPRSTHVTLTPTSPDVFSPGGSRRQTNSSRPRHRHNRSNSLDLNGISDILHSPPPTITTSGSNPTLASSSTTTTTGSWNQGLFTRGSSSGSLTINIHDDVRAAVVDILDNVGVVDDGSSSLHDDRFNSSWSQRRPSLLRTVGSHHRRKVMASPTASTSHSLPFTPTTSGIQSTTVAMTPTHRPLATSPVDELIQRWRHALAEANGSSISLREDLDVVELVHEGIPEQIRPEVWQVMSGAEEERSMYPSDYYTSLVEQIGSARLRYDAVSEIKKDVHRTLATHSQFRTEEGQAALERVLSAYFLRNPESVGYCQSMNQLCGALLLLMPEEDAFWVLTCIVESRMGYYAKSMCGLLVDQRVLEDLLRFALPSLYSHFNGMDVSISAFTVSWFMCLFMEAPIPHAKAVRFWDLLLLYGDEILFQLALYILRKKEEEITSLDEPGDLLTFVLHPKSMIEGLDFRDAFVSISANIGQLTPFISSLREHHQSMVVRESKIEMSQATELMKRFRISELEFSSLYESFLAPSPWSILMKSCITSPVWFTQAFFPHAFSPEHREEMIAHGLLCGVTKRLFDLLDSNHTGTISFNQFLHGIEVFCRGSPEERIQFCFSFCDLDGDKALSKADVLQTLEMFYRLYFGDSDFFVDSVSEEEKKDPPPSVYDQTSRGGDPLGHVRHRRSISPSILPISGSSAGGGNNNGVSTSGAVPPVCVSGSVNHTTSSSSSHHQTSSTPRLDGTNTSSSSGLVTLQSRGHLTPRLRQPEVRVRSGSDSTTGASRETTDHSNHQTNPHAIRGSPHNGTGTGAGDSGADSATTSTHSIPRRQMSAPSQTRRLGTVASSSSSSLAPSSVGEDGAWTSSPRTPTINIPEEPLQNVSLTINMQGVDGSSAGDESKNTTPRPWEVDLPLRTPARDICEIMFLQARSLRTKVLTPSRESRASNVGRKSISGGTSPADVSPSKDNSEPVMSPSASSNNSSLPLPPTHPSMMRTPSGRKLMAGSSRRLNTERREAVPLRQTLEALSDYSALSLEEFSQVVKTCPLLRKFFGLGEYADHCQLFKVGT